uniref:DNA polymerase n=2 Tax=Parascaris univalens TaxID=6257 RepID=A0A914ZC71_PARUN
GCTTMISLCIRNVLCEFYVERPNGFNRMLAHSSRLLPIIRIFGILDSGEKCCVHVHGVFPYIVLRLGTPLTCEVNEVLRSTLASLVAHHRPNVRSELIEAAIYDIVPFSAKSLYGYYKEDDYFVKVLFSSPQYLRLVSNVLYEEAVSSPLLQVYEAHVPYLMQFFIDYSIFGMDLIHFNDVKFRISPSKDITEHYYGGMTVGEILNDTSLVSPLLPSTSVSVECDVFATNISNVELYSNNEISSNPGLNYIWKDEERRCRQRGKKLIIESSQEERSAPVTANEQDWLQRIHSIVKKLQTSQNDSTFRDTQLRMHSFNDVMAEVNRTILMSNHSENVEPDMEELILELEDRDAFCVDDAECSDSRKEIEELEDLSQPLSSLYLPSQNAGPSWLPDQRKADDNNSRSTNEAALNASRSSCLDSSLDELSWLSSPVDSESRDTERLIQKTSSGWCSDFSSMNADRLTKEPVRMSDSVTAEATSSTKHEEVHVEQGTSQSNKSDKVFDVECVASSIPMDKQQLSGTKDDPSYGPEYERTSLTQTPTSKTCQADIAGSRSVERNSERCVSEGSVDLFDGSPVDRHYASGSESSQQSNVSGMRTPSCKSGAIGNEKETSESHCNSPASLRHIKRKKLSTSLNDDATKVGNKGKCLSGDGSFVWDVVEGYENDIGTLWNARRPTKRRIDFEQFHCHFDARSQATGTQDSADGGIWLNPTFRLPLRCRNDPVSKSNTELTQDAIKETELEFSQHSLNEQNGAMSNETMLESWYEKPSFNNYEGVKEKLGATAVLPTEPGSNPDTDHTDLRHLCVMSMEIIALTRPSFPVPEPQFDAVVGIFYTVSLDVCMQESAFDEEYALLNSADMRFVPSGDRISCFEDECTLFDAFANIVRRIDPDLVVGYDTRRYSWGYLVERSIALGRNLLSALSRYPIEVSEYYRPDVPKFELDPSPRGRILLNVWRIIRHELALRCYSRSTVVQTVLSRRFPQFSNQTISEWISSDEKYLVDVAIRHLMLCARLNLQIMSQLDLFTRTAEMARVYGIQFAEVLSRGSQFRVESMLLRLARRHRLTAPSVSPAQRTAMCAPEVLPLNMEPESGYYRDPVIVLDFQSLYPSIVIAYNYCFSTCLGKVSHMDNATVTGFADSMELGGLVYSLPVEDVASMVDNGNVHVSPTGSAFCKKSVRRGIMPIMLDEILNTRIMVKKAAKDYKDSRRLARILDARQMALKLIANVTYGYSAANFSGRMPCVEVADAIVSKGREALERAIALVNEGAYGKPRVIYGDTDSMFVLCPGSTRSEAFEIGERIANDVTMANPNPVKLKLEKVMHPLVLESKKRYVGMSYERQEDVEGVFDAKGIETVRRDSCPLVSRILEKSLRLLFAGNVGAVVRYLDMQLSNLDCIPLSDFVFSREYRSHYADTAVVAAKRIAGKRRAKCARDEPESGERVPYVIVDGEPHSTLISCVREPWEYVKNTRLTLNYDYYVQRHVLPSLQRAFNYVPLRFEWSRPTSGGCYRCHALGARPWCQKCSRDPEALLLALSDNSSEQRQHSQFDRACRECIGLRQCDIEYSSCVNMACKVAQKRIALHRSNTSEAVALHSLSKRSS